MAESGQDAPNNLGKETDEPTSSDERRLDKKRDAEAGRPAPSQDSQSGQVEVAAANSARPGQDSPRPPDKAIGLMEKLLLWIQKQPRFVQDSILVLFVGYTLLTSSVTIINAVQTLGGLMPKKTRSAEGVIINQTSDPIELSTVGDFLVPGPIVPSKGGDLRGRFDLLTSEGVPLDASCITVPKDDNVCLRMKIRDNGEVCEQYQRGDRSLMLKFYSTSGRKYITHIERFSGHGLKEGWELRISDEHRGRKSPTIALCVDELKDPSIEGYGSRLKDETVSFRSDLALGIQEKSRFGPYDRRDYDRIVEDDDRGWIPAEVLVGIFRAKSGADTIVVRAIDARGEINSEHQEFSFPYRPEFKDELITMILQSVREKIVAAYPIEARIDDVFGENNVRLSAGANAGVYEDMELQLRTRAGRSMGTVTITHTWPTISLGQLELTETYDKDRDALRSLWVTSKKTGI